MPTTITNQARLQFTYGATTATASSNIASTLLQEPLTAAKSILESVYRADNDLTFLINLVNSGTSALTPITVNDDLGKYAISPALSVTPLSYVGPARLFIDGVFSQDLTPVITEDGITFTVPTLAAASNAMIIYKVDVNSYAPLDTGSSITNTATVSAASLQEPLTATATVNVDAYADISITKAMSPNPVAGGGTLTYSFTIQNYGNTDATDVVLSDTFTPAPNPITVAVNGTTLAPTNYTYDGSVLTLPAPGSTYALSIPAATFVTDAVTGEITINPGTINIIVTGTL